MFTVEPRHVKSTKFQNLLETAQLVGGGGGLRICLRRRRRHGDTKLESNKTMTRKRSLDFGTITSHVLKQQPFQTRTCRIDGLHLTSWQSCWRYNTKEYVISSAVGSSKRGCLTLRTKN